MSQNLINLRERAMDRADLALDAAWPDRIGERYVSEMQAVSAELKSVIQEMIEAGVDQVELGRTYTNLGSVYSDLAPALGGQMLLKAKETYIQAEKILINSGDELVIAKLNFNYANTLRQIDPNNIDQLNESKRRFIEARKVFTLSAPQFIQHVDTALVSVEALLTIAPLANEISKIYDEIHDLEIEIAEAKDLKQVLYKAKKILNNKVFGMINSTHALIAQLPPEIVNNPKFSELQDKMLDLSAQALNGNTMDDQNSRIWQALQERLQKDIGEGKVSDDRSKTLDGMMGQLKKYLLNDDDDIDSMLEHLQSLRQTIESSFEAIHYLSHGIERPSDGSRAAELVELNWSLRKFVLEEMNRSNKGQSESKALLELAIQTSNIDKHIYEAGDDDKKALFVEKEQFRPLAYKIRSFSARSKSMIANPIWSSVHNPINTNAVFFSGSEKNKKIIKKVCDKLGLELMSVPSGQNIASTRWGQLQSAMITIFDLGMKDGPERAAVAYELGIALCLGKPLLVIASKQEPVPFDVDVKPLMLDGNGDEEKLQIAIDTSLVWTYVGVPSGTVNDTLEYILAHYSRPYPDTFVDQTLRLLKEQQDEQDPLKLDQTISQFISFLKDGSSMLIHPVWQPRYPIPDSRRLFHIMPFSPDWADEVRDSTKKTCEANTIDYVRGDEVEDPNIISSIWDEIARSTDIIIDLTGFNTNVSLELGIAHTLGKNYLLVGQKKTVKHLFPMISRLRFYEYNDLEEYKIIVHDFLN